MAAAIVGSVNGVLFGNIQVLTAFYSGLPSVGGTAVSPARAMRAVQNSFVTAIAAVVPATFNLTDPVAMDKISEATYNALVAEVSTNASVAVSAASSSRRHLLQTYADVQAQVTALIQSMVDSNSAMIVTQAMLVQAVLSNTVLTPAQIQAAVTSNAQASATQSTVIAAAVKDLASGAISPAAFTTNFTGSALTALIATQQLAPTPGTGTPSPPPLPAPPAEEDAALSTGAMAGIVVGAVCGTALIAGAIAAAVIVKKRRKQQEVAPAAGAQKQTPAAKPDKEAPEADDAAGAAEDAVADYS